MVHQIVDAFKKMNVQEELEYLESEDSLYRRLMNRLDSFIGGLVINGDTVHAQGFQKFHREIFIFVLNATYFVTHWNLEIDNAEMFKLLHQAFVGRLYRMGKTEAANEFVKMKDKLVQAANDVASIPKKHLDLKKLIKDKGLGQYVFLACLTSKNDE